MLEPGIGRRSGRRAGFALVTLLVIAACADNGPESCPTFGVGAVQGYVRAAGAGLAVAVGARALEGPQAGEVVAWVTSSDTGWYRLDLPTGRYRLETDPRDAIVVSPDARDTLTVTPDVLHRDLDRGRAEFTFDLPPELEGSWISLSISSQHRDQAQLRGRVVSGSLHCVFPALPAGDYALTLRPGAGWPVGDAVTVGTDAAAVFTRDFRSSYAAISGRVTGSWQAAGAATPVVVAVDADGSDISAALCAPDGFYRLDLLVPRQVRLLVDLDGFEQWVEGEDFASARVFDPGAGGRLAGIDVVESGLDVRLNGPGNLVVDAAEMLILDVEGRQVGHWTRVSQRKLVGNLRAGRYYVHVSGTCLGQTWASQWYGGDETFATAAPVDLAAGELRRLDLDLAAGGRIAGDLLTADGNRPAQVECRLCDAAGEAVCTYGTTFADGVFAFSGLADGDYHLAVGLAGGSTWWYPGTTDFAAATAITVTDHGEVSGLAWRLPPSAKAVPR